MQEKSVSRNELMMSFKALQGQFEQQKSYLKTKEQTFDQLRADFVGQLRYREKNLGLLIGHENPLRMLADGLSGQLSTTLDSWERQVNGRKKGTQFREGFGDSLLVFIYGKVKSGKSSLGNYMAWGHSQPTAALKAEAQQPDYFSAEKTDVASGDKEKEAEKSLQFRVGATEATSSIQGFKLPGLTWVDSPGLHSVNARNGDLAKEYVNHADLIIYTMHSQSPGRASDMEEITELLNSNKKIMILLTGSDTTEEDEDDEGNIVTTVVMKDLKDRQDQIQYVRGELEQLNNKSSILAEVLPISTRYAESSPTPDAMVDSGIGSLLHELQTICSSQALTIKLNAPMENLRRAIHLTAEDLSPMRDLVADFARAIEKQNRDIQQEMLSLNTLGSSKMRSYINQVFGEGESGDLEAKLREKASQIITELAQEACIKIGEKHREGLKQAFDCSRLSKLPEYKELTEEKEYFVGTKKSNKSTLAILGAIGGGVIGLVVGGPAGAALGASLGGGAASAAGRSASAEYGRHKVVVGDNMEERRQAAIESYSNTIPSLLTEYVNTIYEPVYKGMLGYCKALESDMTELMGQIEDLALGSNPQ